MKTNVNGKPLSPGIFLFFRLAVILSLMTTAACGLPGIRPIGDPRQPYPLKNPPGFGEIVHLPTGTSVSRTQMLAVAGDARIVYLGETHDNPASHRLELAVLEALAALHPGRQALGMEMFSRAQQPILDRWIAGKLDEKAFLRESRWYENWGMDYDYYRDLLNFARERHIPIVALNAEKGQVKEIGGNPLDRLSPAKRAELPELDLGDPYERAMVAAYYGGHTHGGKNQDSFLRVQTLWDETMAQSVAEYLAGPAGRDMHMLVIAGGNHVAYGFGIPRRAFRRLPGSYLIIGGQEIDIPADMQDRLMNVKLPPFPMVPYDFMVYLAYEKLPEKVRLGVMTEPVPDGRGLQVGTVLSGSNAERAGLKQGDILLALDGAALKDSFDLMYSVQRKHPGEHGSLLIERQGKKLEVDIFFRTADKTHSHDKR